MLLMMVVVLALMMGSGSGPMGMMDHGKPAQASSTVSVEKEKGTHEHAAPKN
jgi:hypothetical protein